MNTSMNSTDILNMVNALAVARQAEFMSREHAALIWKSILKASRYDVPKPTQPVVGKQDLLAEKPVN